MKQQIENIIKENLPENKQESFYWGKEDGNVANFSNISFNQALSQINPSLIADEILKVVLEKIEEQKIKGGFSEISGSYNSALNDILSALIK